METDVAMKFASSSNAACQVIVTHSTLPQKQLLNLSTSPNYQNLQMKKQRVFFWGGGQRVSIKGTNQYPKTCLTSFHITSLLLYPVEVCHQKLSTNYF